MALGWIIFQLSQYVVFRKSGLRMRRGEILYSEQGEPGKNP